MVFYPIQSNIITRTYFTRESWLEVYNEKLYFEKVPLLFRSYFAIYVPDDYTTDYMLSVQFKPLDKNIPNPQFIEYINRVKNYFRLKEYSLIEAYYEYIPPPFDFYHFYLSSESFLDLQYIKTTGLYTLGDIGYKIPYIRGFTFFPQFKESSLEFGLSKNPHFKSWVGSDSGAYGAFSGTVYGKTEKEILHSITRVEKVDYKLSFNEDIIDYGFSGDVNCTVAQHTIYIPFSKPCCLARCFGIPEGLK